MVARRLLVFILVRLFSQTNMYMCMLGIITQLPDKRLKNEKYLQVIVDYLDHI